MLRCDYTAWPGSMWEFKNAHLNFAHPAFAAGAYLLGFICFNHQHESHRLNNKTDRISKTRPNSFHKVTFKFGRQSAGLLFVVVAAAVIRRII